MISQYYDDRIFINMPVNLDIFQSDVNKWGQYER